MDDRFWPPPFFVMDRRNNSAEGQDRIGTNSNMDTTNPIQLINPPTITVPEFHLPQIPGHVSYAMSGDSGPRLSHVYPSSSGDTVMSLEKSQEFGKFPVTTCNQEFGRFPVTTGNLTFSGAHSHSHFPTHEGGAMCPTLLPHDVQSLNLEKIYGSIESSRRNVMVEPSYPERLLNLTGSLKEYVEKSVVTEVSGIDVCRQPTLDVVDVHLNKQMEQTGNVSEKEIQNIDKQIDTPVSGILPLANEETTTAESSSNENNDQVGETTHDVNDKSHKEGDVLLDKGDQANVDCDKEGEISLDKCEDKSNVTVTESDGRKEDDELHEGGGDGNKNSETAGSENEKMEMVGIENVTNIDEVIKDIEIQCKKLIDCGQEFILVSINEALQFRFLGSDQGKQFLENNPDLAQRFLSYCYRKEEKEVSDDDHDNEEPDTSNDITFEPDEPSDSETLDEVVRRVVSNINNDHHSSEEDKKPKIKLEVDEPATDNETKTVQSKRKRKGVPRKLVMKIKREKITKKDLTCDVCQREWPSISKLIRHKKTHTGEKSYACDMCDKKYTRLYNLKDHMNNHRLKSRQEAGELKSDDESEAADRLQCRVCHLILSSSRSLSRHMLLHTGQVLHTCEKCGKDFKRSDTYKLHLARCGVIPEYDDSTEEENDDEKDKDYTGDESKKRKPKCHLCGKKFRTSQACKMHVKIVHEDRNKFSCVICTHKCSTKSHLNRHMRVHDNSELKYCEKCNKGFKYEQSLAEHVCKMPIAKGVDGKHPCDECGKVFNRRKNLLIHIRIHQDLPAKHLCHICNKAFRDSSNLKKHVRFVHSTSRDFICDICGKGFKQNDTLKVHVQSHNPEKSDKYKCETCGKLLSGSTALAVHERSHLNIKPYVCDICGLAFSQSGNLQKHLLSHTDLKFFKCDLCNKEFKYIETWKAHQRAHALKEGRDDASKFGKVYTCEFCGKKCATASQHKVHLRTHTNERPFPCQYCGKSFKESGKLKRHRKTHLSNNNHRVVVHDIKIESPITIKNYYSHHPETNQTFYNM